MNSDRRHKSAVTKSLLQFYEYLSKALMYREDGKAIQYLAQKKEKKRKKDSKTSPHFKKKAFVWKLKMQLRKQKQNKYLNFQRFDFDFFLQKP